MSALRLAVVASLAGALACTDPVHQGQIDALGPETNVRPGPTHRPGQPCLTCHGGSGPSGTQFSIAGTIYKAKGLPEPIRGVTVHLVDARGSKRDATTNEVGSFYVLAKDWTPSAPTTVSMELAPILVADQVPKMATHIGTDGSCASCHFGKPGPTTPGPVYLVADPADFPGASP